MPSIVCRIGFALTFLVAVALPGCSGGSVGPSATSATSASNDAGVARLIVPAASAAAGRRRDFVSPSVSSATIAVSGEPLVTADLSAGSTACSTSAAGRVCSIAILARPGSATLTVTLYEGPGGTGTVLGSGSSTIDVTGDGFSVPLTVSGQAATIALTAAGTFVAGTAGNVSIVVKAEDAGGNLIVGTYAQAITLASSNAAHFSLSTTSVTASSQTVTLHYDGAAGQTSDTVSANAADVATTAVTGAVVPVEPSGPTPTPTPTATPSPSPTPTSPITVYPVPVAAFGGAARITTGIGGNLWMGNINASSAIVELTTAGAVANTLTDPTSNAQINAIAEGSDGRMYFSEWNTANTGAFTAAGAFSFYGTNGGGTNDAVEGPDANVWFATDNNGIFKETPTGAITFYNVANNASEPSTLAVGPDGNIWYIGSAGACASYDTTYSSIGKMTTSGVYTEYNVGQTGQSFGIAAGSDGRMWFTDPQCGTGQTGRIGAIHTNGTGLTYYSSGITAHPQSIAAGPDGNLYFTESGGKMGRITTAGAVVEWPLPSGFNPFGITAGSDGNMWAVDIAGAYVARWKI